MKFDHMEIGLYGKVKDWGKRFTVISGGKQVDEVLNQAGKNTENFIKKKDVLGLYEEWSRAEEETFELGLASAEEWMKWASFVNQGLAIQEGEFQADQGVRTAIGEDEIENVIDVGGTVTDKASMREELEESALEEMEGDVFTNIVSEVTEVNSQANGSPPALPQANDPPPALPQRNAPAPLQMNTTSQVQKRKREADKFNESVQEQLAREMLEQKARKAVEEEKDKEQMAGASAVEILRLLRGLRNAARREEEIKRKNLEIEAKRETERALAHAKAHEAKQREARERSECEAQEAAEQEERRIDLEKASKRAVLEVEFEAL
ncbi:hypothetical protein BDZ91DRAFT_790842 [Kalaharituber pfeilii]|nr:hypothetical protein BDZ91DRAFT_790842 [Kalaharituber pfeilii]